MSTEWKRLITTHIDDVSSCTKNLKRLVPLLLAKDVIQENEKEDLMETNKGRYEICTELYLLVAKRGDDVFEILCDSLAKTGNEAALKYLKPAAATAETVTAAETAAETATETAAEAAERATKQRRVIASAMRTLPTESSSEEDEMDFN